MDLQQVTADLLALPLEAFTSTRNAKARELKAAGQAGLASDVSKLKKPPVHLWVVNQIARENPELLHEVERAARSVARAQTAGGATARDLRSASEAFQKSLDDAGKAAEKRLQQDHHAATEETLRRVRDIVRAAALQGGESWQALGKGALISEPSGSDEDVLAMFQAAPPQVRSKGGKAPSKGEDPHAARAAERAARMDAERAEQLQEVAKRLRAEADEAAEQARRADERATTAEKQATEARRQASKSARVSGGNRS